jgi:hypothetical protein
VSYSEENGQVVLRMSREEFAELSSMLKAQQIVIHAGQFHQWAKFEICRDRPCQKVKTLLDRLNSGNPHYTPYQVEEKS